MSITQLKVIFLEIDCITTGSSVLIDLQLHVHAYVHVHSVIPQSLAKFTNG